MRYLDKYLWAVLLVLAVGLTVACSNSSTPDDNEGGPGATEAAADALTKG
jgi:hypothetical protein